MRRTLVLSLLCCVAAAAAGCAEDGAGGGGGGPRVVATTTQVADFTRQVGGARVAVDGLLRPTTDPHDFEPRPSDARALAGADVVLRSGGEVDDWLGDVVRAAGGDAEQVTLIDAVDPARTPSGEVDPHWWQDPRDVVAAVGRIRDALSAADPAGRATYARNAERYAARVRALDGAIARCFAAIPAGRRKLVTDHDAFRAFAERFDVEVLGSISPALSTAAQPSAGDVQRLVERIRAAGVRVVFPEQALSRRLEGAVAREAGARVGPPLYADALGRPGTEGASYLGALRHDAAAIAEGFGGRCDDLPTAGG